MAEKFADLHVHTRASDGDFPPEDVVRLAKEAGLAAVGIADHDTIDGIGPALEAGKKYGIEVIPGVELSTQVGDAEVHMLGYFIDWRDEQFRGRLHVFREARRTRARQMVEKLCRAGVKIPYEEVLNAAGGGAVCRPHIAQVMLKHGYVETLQEAFERYIGVACPAYVKKYQLSPAEAIEMIHRARGISVLAHPTFLNPDILPMLIKEGLRGIEVYHSKHDASAIADFKRLAQQYNLLVTGGTDSHGFDVPIGAVRVPYELVEKLKTEQKFLWAQ